ncbi:MAG: GHKL domain-containing protein [Lachnospiraceae bacterium]|nr:GHKL domain-containing protein [Lachnospiraceae bacterium]
MIYVQNISYTLSHIFFLVFVYLFMVHRYSKKKTLVLCFLSFILTTVMNQFKLNLFPGSGLFYFFTTITQIAIAQLTALLISEKRDSKTLFVGLSASNYVVVGSIIASILYILTDSISLALAGNLLSHVLILLLLYLKTKTIIFKFCERDLEKSRWGICLIPVCFYCSFSSIAFFPYTLYDHPENILVSIFLMITMLVSYVVVLRYLDSETKQVEAYWKNVMFGSYIKGLESQNYLTERSEQNLKILRHDMRHYSMMIDSLLDQKEYAEIKNITGRINEVINENKVIQYCENRIVNTAFMTIAEQAQSLQIPLHLDVLIPRQITVNEYALAVVLANLLENAVFSTKNAASSEKSIDAKIHCTDKYLLIDVENDCDQEIHFDSTTGLPKSSRGKEHGLGMKSVQAFCDKLGGTIDCYCENSRFRIILYAKI